jgi:hypothetical protein
MLALKAWSNYQPLNEDTNTIKLFMRLSGKYLGNLLVPKSLSVFQQVRFLQQQAARLCPHPKRTCEDLLLYVGQAQVGPPDMAYLDDLDKEASLQVQTLLKGCTRLEMMWDEADSYAKSKVEQAGIRVEQFGPYLEIHLNGTDLPKELRYLGKQRKTLPCIMFVSVANTSVDFSAFKMRYARSVTESKFLLDVEGLVLYNTAPTNYNHCNVKTLLVAASCVDCENFVGLDQLETLKLDGSHLAPLRVVRNLKALAGLPKLKTIMLNFESMTRQSLSEVLDAMECMPNVGVKNHVGIFVYNARDTLPKILLAKRKIAARRLVVKCMALGLALVTGMSVLKAWWPRLKDRLG